MMTQTHLLIAAAGFTRPEQPLRNTAALLGGLVPDLALYTLFAWSRLSGVSMEEIFTQRYWSPSWQAAMSPGNSIPVFTLLLCAAAIGYRHLENHRAIMLAVMVFAGAALAHIALDFPLHVDDGHTHLWPITDWKFESPVSYWDPDHFGNWVRPLEFVLGLACLSVVFTRFKARWVRALAVFGMIAYIAEPLVFFLFFAS